MDAPFWLRLVTFGYARLRRTTRIDTLGWRAETSLAFSFSAFPLLPPAPPEKGHLKVNKVNNPHKHWLF